jgi:RNA polymerase subunit RPABC4/transcription elongation factor Spt4
MFFFIGGIQPKAVTLEDTPRMCPVCGLYQARLMRVDQYLSLFFIPIVRIKKGTPFLQCRSCGSIFSETGEILARRAEREGLVCPSCGRSIEPGFRFCPLCGKRL